MLSHLSSKFTSPLKTGPHEPRSALFLNRYTRTLTIMYATNGLADLLGLSGEEMTGKSFYYCIQESCLPDAVRCLENAKVNDSIAYLRFWYRDPRQEDQTSTTFEAQSESPVDDTQADERMIYSGYQDSEVRSTRLENQPLVDTPMAENPISNLLRPKSRASSGDSNPYSHETIFGDPEHTESSMSSVSNSITEDERGSRSPRTAVELEAVVSCTSDGMVVCLRRVYITHFQIIRQFLGEQVHDKGLFAAPWSREPILPAPEQRPQYTQHADFSQGLAPGVTFPRPALAQQKYKLLRNDFYELDSRK